MKKLKKTILIVLMIFAAQSAFGAPALALGTPMAVQGQVTLNGTPADGASVVVTDANTGAFLTDTVGPTGNSLTSGYYSVDLGNLSIAAANGDVINIVATINGFSGNTSFVYNSAAGFVTPAVIAISSPVATQLAFTTQPSASAVNNALFAPQPVVEIQGAGGQIINTATTTISINAYTDSACLNLALNAPNGTLSVAAAAGQAIFTNLSYSLATPPAAGIIYLGATATAGALTPACSNAINIYVPATTSITVTPPTASILAGNTQQFSAVAYDQFGAAINPQPTFAWTSASTSIATISAAGLATGVSAGTATITATSGTVSGSATLNVEAPILTGINVSPNKGIVKIGSTLQLHASGLDQSGLPLASQPAFTWTSASTTIASVSSNGLVTGLAVGTSTITATSGTVSGSATITVSTSTRIELLCDDKVEIEYELENNGALIPEINDDYASTTALTATHDILIRMLSGQGEYEIEMPAGVRISREDGASINGRSLTATTTVSGLSGLGSEEIKGAVKWGIPNVGLNFSLPITLRIFVGAALNGQTVNIVRSTSGSGGWTSAGIVAPATSLVVNGLATFQATKASYYAATMPAPAPAQGGGGGGGTSGVIVGGTVISTQSSSAPAATAEQQSSTSANTDQTAYVQPRVLGEKIYSNGQLIRGTNMKIYVIVNGMKKRIINLEELKKYKGKTIYNVSVQILAAYPEVLGEKIYANGSLIKTPDKKIYVIAGGKAKHIINLQELQKYRGKKIIKVNYEALINYES